MRITLDKFIEWANRIPDPESVAISSLGAGGAFICSPKRIISGEMKDFSGPGENQKFVLFMPMGAHFFEGKGPAIDWKESGQIRPSADGGIDLREQYPLIEWPDGLTSRRKVELSEELEKFCRFLEKAGYLDSDWWSEQPMAIPTYLSQEGK